MVEHQSRKLGVVGSNPTGGRILHKNFCRSWQGSNLRGQSPLDFKSNALTTRPQLPIPTTSVKNLVTQQKSVEMRGIKPRAFHMQSERPTTELHPRFLLSQAAMAEWLRRWT